MVCGPAEPAGAALPQAAPSLARNTVLNVLARIALVLSAIVTTPIVFARLNPAEYGVYVLALSLGGMTGVLDLGLMPAVVMVLSQAWHADDRRGMQRDLSSAFTLFLVIGITVGGALALVTPWVVTDLLHISPPQRESAEIALWLAAGGFALSMWFAVFEAVPIALERYGLIAARTAVLSVMTTVAIIVCALKGGGLQGLMIVNVLSSAAGLVLFYRVSRSLLPFLHFRPGLSRGSVWELARFSGFKFAGSIGGVLVYRFDQFAIASILGVQAVAFYSIPANASLRLSSSLLQLVTPLFPRISKHRGDEQAIRQLLLDGVRTIMLVASPVLLSLFVFADLVLRFWIGGARGEMVALQSTPAFRWLLLAFLVQAVAAVPGICSEALGRPEVNNGFAVAGALVHVPLVLVLVPTFGITGAALALCINSATQTVVFIAFASRKLAGISARALIQSAVARSILAALPAMALGYAVRPLIHGTLALVCAFGLVFVTYAVVARVISAVTDDDVTRLRSTMQWIKRLLLFGRFSDGTGRYETDAR